MNASPSDGAGEGECRNGPFRYDAGQMCDAGFYLLVEAVEHFLIFVPGVAHNELHAQHVVRGESWSNALQANKAADEQSSSD